jgi:EmrB/QacA subfamily drug resistance transporter
MFSRRMNERWWTMLTIAVGIYMSTLDASVVNVALPTIVTSLATDVKTVAWVVMGYLIVITGCLLLMGGLADLLGQGRIYVLGFIAFTAGSGLCGLSPTIHFLIMARVIQGLGASALMAVGPAIITSVFPQKDRGQALGITGSIVSVGFITGPLIGGFLVEHLGWRSVFFVNLPIGAIGIFLSMKVLERRGPKRKASMDLQGAFLLFLLIISLLLVLNQMSESSAWFFWPLTGFCLVMFILFTAAELRSPSPLVDLRIFRRQLFSISLCSSLLAFWISGAHTFIVPFFLQDILGFTPAEVGLLIFPLALTVMVIAPLGGRMSDRVGVRLPATLGLIIISLSVFSFSLLQRDADTLEIIGRQILMGVGIAFFSPANNSAIIGSLPSGKVGLASSFLALSRNLGMAVGVAIAEMVISLKSTGHSAGTEVGAPTLEAIQWVWKLALPIGGIAGLLSWVGRRGAKKKASAK